MGSVSNIHVAGAAATLPSSEVVRQHEPDEQTWRRLISAALQDPASSLRLVFQPIVSLQDAIVVGYEALSRFDGLPGVTPDRWFAAAARQGLGAELEALVVQQCLHLRSSLPPNCFLTCNVSPHLLAGSAVSELLLAAGDLRPLVIELTEHEAVVDMVPLLALRDRLADAGALLALDDAGSGYSGLQQLAQFRPDLIKLDRALVSDADTDQVKLALAETLGEFGGRIDAWLLAEGLETWGELEAFQRLRVPLGQGYLLGRPAPPWSRLHPATAARLRSGAARMQLVDHVASLVEHVPVVHEPSWTVGRIGLQIDGRGRPQALALPLHRDEDPPGRHRIAPISLTVSASTSVAELARRIAARPEDCRFDPVVCVDDVGSAVGVVRVEQVLLRLAELKSSSDPVDGADA